MPVYNHFYLVGAPPTPGTAISPFHAGPLASMGPQIAVDVHLPMALANQLSQQGKPVRGPVSGTALFDTGASISAVDGTVIQSLDVRPVGVTNVRTPSGTAQQNQYPVRFVFPGSPLPAIETTHAIGSVLRAQGIIALIGRDVLSAFIFVYNGPGGFITLAF